MKRIDAIRRHRWWIALGLLATVGMVAAATQGLSSADEKQVADPAAVAQARELSRAFRGAALRVQPTVVKIQTLVKAKRVDSLKAPLREENPFKGTPFEDFFDDDWPGFRFRQFVPPRKGVGSGVIIDSKGTILTNNHVVAGADEVLIELPDGRQFKGTDIKTDEQTDLAVVQVRAKEPLPAAVLGNSDELEIGDWVLAVGNPFELDGTVSAGILSGKGRALRAGKRTDFLQTDAAINPGNSGGPLVNLEGKVVGINTAIASSTGGYQGVGFAIPINVAKWVTAQLVEKGTVERAYLGVGITEIDGQLAEQLGVPRGKGVVVSEVFPNTPAASAGFEVGDVIVSFAGRPVSNPRELQAIVERASAGSKQIAKILRDGKPRTLSVVVKPLPGDFGLASGRADRAPGQGPGFRSDPLGLEVGELTEPVAEQLGYEGFSGVLITDVDVDGLAAQAGLAEGMLILRVGNKPVKSVDDFKSALKDMSLEDGVLLLVRTSAGNRFVVLKSS